jgi:hypothetical protein
MARFAALAALVFAVVAAPASASTQISWGTRPPGYIPPFWAPYMRIIAASGDDGANHDIVVKPSGARQFNGFPQVVDVYDYGDTVVPGPGNPCRIYSAHHAACIASGGPNVAGDAYSYTSYAEVDISTGDGNDTVEVNGNDTINTENGAIDQVVCGAGTDNWQADPVDSNHFDSGYGPPIDNDCENRTPPVPSP